MTHHIPSALGRRSFMAGGVIVTVAAALAPIATLAATTGDAASLQAQTAPFSAAPGGLDWFAVVPGEEMAIHVPSELVGGRFTALESIAKPGASTPPHIHQGADEYFFIQEGRLHFICDGVEFDALSGTSVVIPRGAAHSWVNLTDKPARSLVTFTPGGIEGMFPQMAAAFPQGIEALAARYDTYLVK